MLIQIFNVVAPVFVLAGFGYAWCKKGIAFDIPFATRLSMMFSLPCLMFSVLAKMEIDPQAFQDLALASVGLYAGFAAIGFAILKVFNLSQRVFLTPFAVANTGNLGLPLCLYAYGEEGLIYALVVFAVMTIFYFSFGLWLMTGQASPREMFKQPALYATALGALFAYQGWVIPTWLDNTLTLGGQIMIPLMLITLGVSVANLTAKNMGRALWLTLAKFTVGLVLSLGLAHYFNLTEAARGALVLQAITPFAVTSYLLAQKYDSDPNSVAGCVVVSTVLSLVFIPATLAYLF